MKSKMGTIAGHLMSMRSAGKLKKGPPPLMIDVSAQPGGMGMMPDMKYERKENARLRKEIAALEAHLKNLDPEYVMDRTKHAIKSQLAVKKARLAESHARLGQFSKSKKATKSTDEFEQPAVPEETDV